MCWSPAVATLQPCKHKFMVHFILPNTTILSAILAVDKYLVHSITHFYQIANNSELYLLFCTCGTQLGLPK